MAAELGGDGQGDDVDRKTTGAGAGLLRTKGDHGFKAEGETVRESDKNNQRLMSRLGCNAESTHHVPIIHRAQYHLERPVHIQADSAPVRHLDLCAKYHFKASCGSK